MATCFKCGWKGDFNDLLNGNICPNCLQSLNGKHLQDLNFKNLIFSKK